MKNKTIKTLSILVILGILIFSAILVNPVSARYPQAISVIPDSISKSGLPGTAVSYTLTISNIGEPEPQTLTLSATSAMGWTPPSINPTPLFFVTNRSLEVTVIVPIPASATAGQNDITTITIASGSESKTVQLTTSVTTPSVTGRPLLGIRAYNAGSKPVVGGSEFNLEYVLENRGPLNAVNVVITFDGTGFYPRNTGGVQSVGNIDSNGTVTFNQPFLAGVELSWQDTGTIKASVSYTDPSGQAFSEVFTLTINLRSPIIYNSATATPKATLKPQLVITGYQTDVDPLQPGTQFDLKLEVKNLGTADAKNITMVVGGGVAPGNDSGTPQSGGVSGSAGDLTNFAPIGSSNVIFIGNIEQDMLANIEQSLVVNVTTQPGAYTLKISFVYDDPKGTRYVDDQVITLLVYSLPQVEVGFYRDAGVISAGMSNILPLQVTNLGKKTTVLGNMKVTAQNAEVMNNVALVGALDPGGYFTLDSELIPFAEGTLDIEVSINYTDDFNQPRFVTQILTVEVQPAMEIDPGLEGQPGTGGIPVDTAPETFWGKVVRFFKGLFGLDSGVKEPAVPSGVETIPTDSVIPVRPPEG